MYGEGTECYGKHMEVVDMYWSWSMCEAKKKLPSTFICQGLSVPPTEPWTKSICNGSSMLD